mmetsp:Transcript_32952/g.97872  ORF Transcript_32952/g.97872 Transcript_32952/m.97872 type:complete len:200 (+) Transcript_32952:719-1318(+)
MSGSSSGASCSSCSSSSSFSLASSSALARAWAWAWAASSSASSFSFSLFFFTGLHGSGHLAALCSWTAAWKLSRLELSVRPGYRSGWAWMPRVIAQSTWFQQGSPSAAVWQLEGRASSVRAPGPSPPWAAPRSSPPEAGAPLSAAASRLLFAAASGPVVVVVPPGLLSRSSRAAFAAARPLRFALRRSGEASGWSWLAG